MTSQSDHIDAIALTDAPFSPVGEKVPAPRTDEGAPSSPPSTTTSPLADLPSCEPEAQARDIPNPTLARASGSPPPDARCPIPDAQQRSALLRDYLEGAPDLISLAELHDLELDALLDFLEHPRTQAQLERLQRHAETRAAHAASAARAEAITTLRDIARRQPTNATETTAITRAAAALLRSLSPSPGGTGFQPVSPKHRHNPAGPRTNKAPAPRQAPNPDHPTDAHATPPAPTEPPTLSAATNPPDQRPYRCPCPPHPTSPSAHHPPTPSAPRPSCASTSRCSPARPPPSAPSSTP